MAEYRSTLTISQDCMGSVEFSGAESHELPMVLLGVNDPKPRRLVAVRLEDVRTVVFVLDDTKEPGDSKQVTIRIDEHPHLFRMVAQLIDMERSDYFQTDTEGRLNAMEG